MTHRDTLDTFTRAYITTMLWAETDQSDPTGGETLAENYGIEDIAPEAMAQIVADCTVFQIEHADAINAADGNVRYGPDCDSALARAGHDFWLTRNRHGAGFWDGDWPEPLATTLTDAAKEFVELFPYIGDDGMIYF